MYNSLRFSCSFINLYYSFDLKAAINNHIVHGRKSYILFVKDTHGDALLKEVTEFSEPLTAKNAKRAWNESDLKLNEGNKISIYPKPSHGICNTSFNEDFTGSVAIFNYLGQQVQPMQSQKKIRNYQFDLSVESAGIYFLGVNSEIHGASKAFKIIKK